MQTIVAGLTLLTLAVSASDRGCAKPADSPPPRAPQIVVDLAQFGWAPPRDISNREFFKDFTLAKLFALDENTKVVFLDEEVVINYHTKQDGRDWRTTPRFIEAFFVSSKDGRLLATQRWPTGLRTSTTALILRRV